MDVCLWSQCIPPTHARLARIRYGSFGLGAAHVAKVGSLVVAWTPDEASRLPAVLADNAAAGDDEVRAPRWRTAGRAAFRCLIAIRCAREGAFDMI